MWSWGNASSNDGAQTGHNTTGALVTDELARISALLNRFRSVGAESVNAERTLCALPALPQLFSGLREIEARSLEERRRTSDTFNIFRLTGIESAEVSTHSRLLADLLNPRGAHGQGAKFLAQFFATCREQVVDASGMPLVLDAVEPLESWRVHLEWTAVGSGRLDVVLESSAAGWCICIENKINALERENQLEDYDSALRTKWPGRNTAVIFLTPDGRESAFQSRFSSYYRMSYCGAVAGWIQRMCATSMPDRLRWTLEQYFEVVRDLGKEQSMADLGPIGKFILQRENFGPAREVKRQMLAVEEFLHGRFWRIVRTQVEQGLTGGDWCVCEAPDRRFPVLARHRGVIVCPSELPTERGVLLFVASEEYGHPYVGLVWNPRRPTDHAVDEKLKSSLGSVGGTAWRRKEGDWEYGWGVMADIAIADDEYFRQLVEDESSPRYACQVADYLLNVFEVTHRIVGDLNRFEPRT